MPKQKVQFQLISKEKDAIYNGYEELPKELITGMSKDLSEIRTKGGLCYRAELDNQPTLKGYIGPMYNGTLKDGTVCLRYETQYVYDLMFD